MTARQGFTLMELVLVIVIIGALSAIIMVRYVDHESAAKTSAVSEMVRVVQRQIARHHAENGNYPADIDPAWFAGTLETPWTETNKRTLISVVTNNKIVPNNKDARLRSSSILVQHEEWRVLRQDPHPRYRCRVRCVVQPSQRHVHYGLGRGR